MNLASSQTRDSASGALATTGTAPRAGEPCNNSGASRQSSATAQLFPPNALNQSGTVAANADERQGGRSGKRKTAKQS